MKNLDELIELIGTSWKPPRFKIVCICGSVRFRTAILAWACHWSKNRHVVVMPHCFSHGRFHDTEDKKTLKMKRQLDLLHFRKIAIADFVFVVDVGGYIGESTAREIRAAKKLGKPVKYASKTPALLERV